MTARRVWHALELRVAPSETDLAAAALSALPLTGIEEGPDGSGTVVAFAEAAFDEAAVRAELLALGCGNAGVVPALRSFRVEEEDWLARWKAGWRPTPLGERLVVVPAWWREAVPAGRAVVRLDPGLAFGTGTHETTALAWELLEQRVAAVPSPRRMIDVGAGTGVLSVGAALLAPGLSIVATERDALAVPTLVDAVRANGVSGRILAVRADSLPVPPRSLDVAVANLTAAEHRTVDEGLAAALASSASLVLSGFLHAQFDEGLARWAARGFAVAAERRRGEWAAARLIRG